MSDLGRAVGHTKSVQSLFPCLLLKRAGDHSVCVQQYRSPTLSEPADPPSTGNAQGERGQEHRVIP